MGIFEEYQQAIATRDEAWWCRQRDDAKESDLKCIESVRSQIVEWRIGWAKTVCHCAEQEVLNFLESISDSWECGKKSGEKHARRGDHQCTDTKCFLDYRVISFRHAAWLLGWLKGFEKEYKKDVSTPRRGRKGGRAAAKAYGCLLVHRNWKDDRHVRKLLEIK